MTSKTLKVKQPGKSKTETAFEKKTSTERWGLVLIILLTFITYSGSLKNGFCWDDSQNIINNPELNGHSGPSFIKLISTAYVNAYTPITQISYWLNYQISQLKPASYHFIDLILHLIAITLVYRFVRLLLKDGLAALFAAALFALHPLQVETVSWVSARSTTICVIFLLMALTEYVNYLRGAGRKSIWFVFFYFILACFAKQSAIVLPVLLFAVDYFEKRKISFPGIFEKLPFIFVALLFVFLTLHFRHDDASIAGLQDSYSIGQKVLIPLFSAGYYVFHFIFPFQLTTAFGIPNLERDSFPWEIYPALIVLILFVVFAIKPGPYQRHFVFANLFYFISLAPVLQIIPFGRDLVADRYAYLPLVGLCLLTGVLLKNLISNYPRKSYSFLGIVVLFLAYISHSMTEVWKNDITLFENAISKRPENFFPYYYLGSHYTNLGDTRKAMEYFDASLSLKPDYADTYINRAKAISQTGNADLALLDLEKAMKLSPGNALVYYSRGTLRGMKGDFLGAHHDLDSAILLKPEYADAFYNRGMSNMSLKDTLSACADWKKAFELGSKPAEQMVREYCR